MIDSSANILCASCQLRFEKPPLCLRMHQCPMRQGFCWLGSISWDLRLRWVLVRPYIARANWLRKQHIQTIPRLLYTNPLSEPVLVYCWWNTWEKLQWNMILNYNFHTRKLIRNCPRSNGHFVSPSTCYHNNSKCDTGKIPYRGKVVPCR